MDGGVVGERLGRLTSIRGSQHWLENSQERKKACELHGGGYREGFRVDEPNQVGDS